MPHTKKKKNSSRFKRIEIEDEDGWTRVTKASNSTPTGTTKPTHSIDGSLKELRQPKLHKIGHMEQVIPDDASVEKATARYKVIEEHWVASEAWSALRAALTDTILQSAQPISSCILFGSGSVTGWFRGWIERHDVALTQIAVFKSVVDTITSFQDKPPTAYAQEPEYNHLDIEFLKTLKISSVQHPQGFELLDKSSFAYAPGAEFDVAMASVFCEPRLYLGHELDNYTRNERGIAVSRYKSHGEDEDGKRLTLDEKEAIYGPEYVASDREEYENECIILERFKANHASLRIPDFDAKDYPFYEQRIYYRVASPKPDDKPPNAIP